MLYDSSPLQKITGKLLRPGGLELTRKGLDLCAFPPGARLLDIGCGAGASLDLLRALGYEAIGLDLSRKLLLEASDNSPRVQGDSGALPFADSSFDGLVSECVLSLSTEPAALVCEWGRAMKPGSRILFSDLYVRLPIEDVGTNRTTELFPCADGALNLSCLTSLFIEHGFHLMHVTDHSHLLAQLAAQIVWHFDSLENFSRLWQEKAGAAFPQRQRSCSGQDKSQFGYILIIAEKGEEYETARHKR